MRETLDDQSSDCLISDNTGGFEQAYRKRFKLRIAICVTLLLSAFFAVTAVILITVGCQTSQQDWDDDLNLGVMPPTLQKANSIHITASRNTAKVIVTRLPLHAMELDFEFTTVEDAITVYNHNAPESCESDDSSVLQCIEWPSPNSRGVRLTLNELGTPRAQCFNISIIVHANSTVTSCMSLKGKKLYGSHYRFSRNSLDDGNVIYLSGYDGNRYWITSEGEALYVPPEGPLLLTASDGRLCLKRHLKSSNLTYPRFNTVFCGADNARNVFLASSQTLMEKSVNLLNEPMIRNPIWSVAKSSSKSISELIRNITKFEFNASLVEIDDNSETCYSNREFGNMTRKMIEVLHDLNIRVIIKIHPFVNRNCADIPKDLLADDYDVNFNDSSSKRLLNFTNPDTISWFTDTLSNLHRSYNIDGFNFESYPTVSNDDGQKQMTSYVQTIAHINSNNSSEIHSHFMTPHVSSIYHMNDTNCEWGFNNGLKSLIPTYLSLNMIGYNVILPSLICKKGKPDKELFIRWIEVTAFMPVMKFSYAPWDFDTETLNITRKYIEIHRNFSKLIMDLSDREMLNATPINLPIWWIAPRDTVAQNIDSEFLLGERLLIAPVLDKGAVTRDIYLPSGTWREIPPTGLRPVQGPVWLYNYSAPLDHTPLFERIQTDAVTAIDVELA